MTPYCPTPQHLLHMQKEVNLLSFEDCLTLKKSGESKFPGYLKFLWNYSQTYYSDVRWCTSKWKLGHSRKKKGGGITPRLPFHYPIFFKPSPTRKFIIFKTIFVLFSLSSERDEEYIETSYYIVYTRLVYRRGGS